MGGTIMSFDPSTAQPQATGFDPNSARPAEAADSHLEVEQFWAEHPYFKAAGDTLQQAFVNPVVQAGNSIIPAINGVSKGLGFPEDQKTTPISGPDMSNAPFAAKVLGDVAGGATQGGAATVIGGGNPFLGFGALSGLNAYGRNENPVPAAIKGAILAVPQVVAGKLGSTGANIIANKFGNMFGQFAPQVIKYAPNVGTALGMGGAAAAMAPEGERMKAAASGATFGAISPMEQFGAPKQMTQEEYNNMIDSHASVYRDILNPGKGIINKMEIKSGKDLNDTFKLAAQEGLVINKDEGGKLDTTGAIKQTQEVVNPLYSQLNDLLSTNTEKQFNLNDIGDQVKAKLEKTTKSASEFDAAKSVVDREINAEIARHGEDVDGQTLNTIKQGMWGKSFNIMEPNANATARQIGFAAKDAIEQAYPEQAVKETNAQIGKYLDLQKLLEATHGQIVQKGKIGQYAAKGTGLAIGALAGHASNIPGAEAVGGVIGNELGGRVSSWLNDPERITSGLANKINNTKISNPSLGTSVRPGAVTPEIVSPKPGEYGFNPFQQGALPNLSNVPLGIPNIFSERGTVPQESNVINMGSPEKPSTPIAGEPVPKPYTPGPEAVSGGTEFPVKEPIKQKELTPEAKAEAQKQIDNYWYKKFTGQELPNFGKKIATVGLATALGTGIFGGQSQANQNIDINKINQIESSGKANAIGDNGKAFGINQIHQGTLSDYNDAHGSSFTTDDLMNKSTNNTVADWYYNKEAPRLLNSYKIPDTLENRISVYNEGIGNLRKRLKNGEEMPMITKNYIKKYRGIK